MPSLFSFGGEPPVQDYVIMGGKTSPGRCELVGAGTPRKWDIRAGYGLSGATVVYAGDGLAKFDLNVFLWEDSHWSDWDDFASVLEKAPKGQRPKAVGISHPILVTRPLNITSVVVEDVLQPVQDESGEWMIAVKLLEYRAPLAVLGTPNQAIPPLQKAPLPVAQDEADRQIQALLKQFTAGLQ